MDLQNPGIGQFLSLELPWLLQQDARWFVSIVGRSLGEYAELAAGSAAPPASPASRSTWRRRTPPALGLSDVREPFHAARVVAAVLRDLPRGMPVLAKLRSDVLRVAENARTVLDAGAAAVVVGKPWPRLPDVEPPA